jgi:succinate dehydrogenase / fumarate reductase flavoprotein subunit
MQRTMQRHCAVFRDGPLLEEGLRQLDEVIEMMHSDLSVTDRSTWAPRLSVRPIAE